MPHYMYEARCLLDSFLSHSLPHSLSLHVLCCSFLIRARCLLDSFLSHSLSLLYSAALFNPMKFFHSSGPSPLLHNTLYSTLEWRLAGPYPYHLRGCSIVVSRRSFPLYSTSLSALFLYGGSDCIPHLPRGILIGVHPRGAQTR